MTCDDIIKLALEAGFCKDSNGIYSRRAVTPDSDLLPSLAHFAALVTAEKDKEIERLREEVRVLRLYGNKDCTSMADEALKQETPR
jgi:hypothetical protein